MIRSDTRGRVVVIAMAVGILSSARTARADDWPVVRALHAVKQFRDGPKASADWELTDLSGRPLYGLRCHSAGYTGDPGFDYSGDFECRLVSLYSKEVFSTLLTENPDQHHDWDSRGRFLSQELDGECARIPEFGARRTFRLRGMRIALEMKDVVLGPEIAGLRRRTLASFTFIVDVRSDPTARSEIAERINLPEPTRLHPDDPKDFRLNCSRM